MEDVGVLNTRGPQGSRLRQHVLTGLMVANLTALLTLLSLAHHNAPQPWLTSGPLASVGLGAPTARDVRGGRHGRSPRTKPTSPEEAHDRLVEWLLRGGAELHGVSGRSKKEAGGGRGLYANKELTTNEVAFTIPAALWVSERNARQRSAVGAVLVEDETARYYGEKNDEGWGMILMMEYEKYSEHSQWKPYLDFIPKPASPLLWNAEELAEFQSPHLVSRIEGKRDRISYVYRKLMVPLFRRYPAMFSVENNTPESFAASTVTVWTRSFDVGSKEKEFALVPMGDLLNHKSGGPKSTWHLSTSEHSYCDGSKEPLRFVFKTTQPYQDGDEIFISYGNHRSSVSWIQWAGFIPHETTYGDFIQLEVAKKGSGSSQAAGRRGQLFSTFVWADGAVPDKFLALYETLWAHQHGELAGSLSMAQKRRVTVQLLAEAVKASEAAHFPTTLEDDERLQLRVNLSFQKRLALAVRIRFKRIIRKISEGAEHWQATGKWVDPAARFDPDDAVKESIVDQRKATEHYAMTILTVAPPSQTRVKQLLRDEIGDAAPA